MFKTAEQYEFIRSFNLHDDMGRIGPLKPVATPKSMPIMDSYETDTAKFLRLWKALRPEDIKMIQAKFKQSKKFTPNAYIHPDPSTVNKIIFYAVEYVALLAAVAKTTTIAILEIIATGGEKTQPEMDIINVAFNDPDKMLSESGKLLKTKLVEATLKEVPVAPVTHPTIRIESEKGGAVLQVEAVLLPLHFHTTKDRLHELPH